MAALVAPDCNDKIERISTVDILRAAQLFIPFFLSCLHNIPMASATSTLSRPKKCNLGSGNFSIPGCVNVRFLRDLKPDVVHNLDEFPYPFEDEAFEEICASHVLDHLKDPFAAMREWRRILKPGGKLVIKVAHFSPGFTHPDHKRGFDVSLPLYINPNMKPWFVGTHLDLEKMRLHWNGVWLGVLFRLGRIIRRMCGVIGISGPSGSDLLKRLVGTPADRGPDAEGGWDSPDLSLGHRRLAIIGLDAGGRQPMVSRSRRCEITFNGEIYNYLEIADRLEAADKASVADVVPTSSVCRYSVD